MFLKSLKLIGFKSFADRTRLELRPGLTVVVGPNGSGKSNVVDALAWVMGTQSPKSLRTDRMDDVIFAGTATRPGMGRAEVTLVFDNASGALALDLPEVSITRRLYRDGSSDYEINGVGCRLLDIQELLSDSGVGKSQHVIIGQGQIDSVLNAEPDDHRAVIEEAAGILKHRMRKDKTIRRLERTDGDVLRLNDLLTEIARQIRPLRRQAEAAARHAEVAGMARSLRLHLAGTALTSIDSRTKEVQVEVATIADRDIELGDQLRETRAALGILKTSAGEVGRALDRDSGAAARLATTAERLRRIGSVAQERARAGRARVEGADERLQDLAGERDELATEHQRITVLIPGLTARVADAERRFRSLEDEERSLADQEAMTSEGAVAVVRGDLRSLDAAADRDERELKELQRRIEGLSERRVTEMTERSKLNDEIRHLDSQVGSAQRSYEVAERERRTTQTVLEEAEARHRTVSVDLAGARARYAGLEQAASGLADPEARRIAEETDGAIGSVIAHLDVPHDLAAAVDAALGAWSDAVLYNHEDATRAAIDRLKSEGRGGVPMVMKPSDDRTVLNEPIVDLAELGAEWLVDVLGPSCDRRLASELLKDVVLSGSWTLGWRIVRLHPHLRVVTPDGDLLTVNGVRVAHPDGATPAMLETAGVDVEIAERELARADSLLMQARRAFDIARNSERETLEALESLETGLAGATETLGRMDRLIVSINDDLTSLETRTEALGRSTADRDEDRNRLVRRLEALEGEEAERQRAWEELVSRRHEVGMRRETARAEWQDGAGELRSINNRLEMVIARLAVINDGIDAERTADVDPGSLERLESVALAARRAVDVVRSHIEELRDRQATLRSRSGVVGERIGRLQGSEDECVQQMTDDERRRSELAVESAELRVRRETICESLRRDLDVDEDVARAEPRPVIDSDDLEAELQRVEAELRRMGPVNPLAADEYREKSERHGFLTEQLDDLERARNELRSVIEALDTEIQQRFQAAYDEAATAFEEHFATLFPGGRGRLRLTDPDDPLRSGVEIEAQPLGKKVAKMSLLSGGERSLAALAFLFAVFRARPSPFYVLDEVEAALDDANLRRFLRLLDTFRTGAQLVVVTHQQQTMEAADVLYGVTMEPGGSSTVVAKTLTGVISMG